VAQVVKEKISTKSAAIVAAALALSAIVMPAEPLPVAKPSGRRRARKPPSPKIFARVGNPTQGQRV